MIIDREAINLLARSQRKTIDRICLTIRKSRKLRINFSDFLIDRLKLLLVGLLRLFPLLALTRQANRMVLPAALLLVSYCFDMLMRIRDLCRARVALGQKDFHPRLQTFEFRLIGTRRIFEDNISRCFARRALGRIGFWAANIIDMRIQDPAPGVRPDDPSSDMDPGIERPLSSTIGPPVEQRLKINDVLADGSPGTFQWIRLSR